MANTNPARGMRDFLPGDVRKREYVIGIIKEVYESYGFEPLETPAVENLETLMGKYGEEGNQLIFRILKRGEKLDEAALSKRDLADLALRYDLTVPLARVVANNRNELPRFFKRYQIQPVWRADRPARGRFREFYQCDVDAIGSRSMVVEAELIMAVSEILTKLGFEDFVIRVNHRKLLSSILNYLGIEESRMSDVLVTIDKLDKINIDGVYNELLLKGVEDHKADALAEFFSELRKISSNSTDNQKANEKYLADLREALDDDASKIATNDIEEVLSLSKCPNVLIDASLARGLSYYTGMIMEINVPDLAGSLGGGGRYDGLIGMFGKEQIPACGFSLGLERILVVMSDRRMFPSEISKSTPADILVTIWNEESMGRSLSLASELRNEGLRTLVYPNPTDKLAKQIKYADEIGIPKVAIVGPNEAERNIVNIKDLRLGQQIAVSPPTLPETKALSGSRTDLRKLIRDIFHEFLALAELRIDWDSITEEKYPNPDFSCILDGSKTYFEIKLLRNTQYFSRRMREALSQAYFAPDGQRYLIFCIDDKLDEAFDQYVAKLKTRVDFHSFPFWTSVYFYERKTGEVAKVQ